MHFSSVRVLITLSTNLLAELLDTDTDMDTATELQIPRCIDTQILRGDRASA